MNKNNEVIAYAMPAAPPHPMPLSKLNECLTILPTLDDEDVSEFQRDLETIRRTSILPPSQWD